MAKFTGHAPVLLVSDVVASAAYYRDALGFCYEQMWGDPPCFCILHRDGLSLMIGNANAEQIQPNTAVRPGTFDVYFWVDDVWSLHDAFEAAGAKVVRAIQQQEYGCLEFIVADLDGNQLAFGQCG